jgi:hypothetical protein
LTYFFLGAGADGDVVADMFDFVMLVSAGGRPLLGG